MLARLARFSFRKRWLMVFGIWLPLMVLLNVISGALGTNFHTDFTLPDSESKQVVDILQSTGQGERGGDAAQIVFTASQGTQDPAVRQAMESFFAEIATLPKLSIISPYSPEGAQFNSPDPTKNVSFAEISYEVADQAEMLALGEKIVKMGDQVDVPGLRIEYGGQLFATFEFPESELLGILAAVLILLIAFGSVLAMGLPIGTALFGLGTGLGLIGLASRVFSMPEFSPQMAAMIGLGVGIDYALFIVTRYRELLHSGLDPEQATVAAVDSSGRAVLFAGLTVMISLLGLFVVGLQFVRGLAISGALSVLTMMIAAVTLLPALLGFSGRRIDNTTRAAAIAVALFVSLALVGVFSKNLGSMLGVGLIAAVVVMVLSYLPFGRNLRTLLPHRKEKPREEQFWYRWSRWIQHRPWPWFIGGASVLIILALPLFSIRLGFGDTGNLPTNTTARQAYDLISDGFGPGYTGPLILVTDTPADAASLATVNAALSADSGVAFVSPPVDMGSGVHLWQVYATTGPQDAATTDLVNRLRTDVLPSTALDVKVGGFNAGSIDFASYLGGRLPYLIGGVLVLSFLLLMVVFRSLLVPLKAVIMNLLSVGAAYGVIVAIFQWGWGMRLIGVDRAGPVEAWAPMMLFAIVFGLSMDYEVFLLSRMKEEFDRTGDNATAVANGLAVTARVITAAALIMVCVFSAFVLGYDRQLKLFGLGMAVAVFVDATIVRMVLVPATMELLGARNWWLPNWLDRLLPHINVEGTHLEASMASLADADLPERPAEELTSTSV